MPLTVQDCLKLPSLKKAVVVGGHKGMNRPVDFVTVMEVTAKEDVVPDFFKKNQMAISALAAIKHDVEAQCALLRVMDECATSGLILFQYGQDIPKLDTRVIATADELNFPLICVELASYEILYTDVIHDITGLIFRTQLNNQHFEPDLLGQRNIYGNGVELLISSILKRQYEQQRYLSDSLKIDLSKIGAVWLTKCGQDINPYALPLNKRDYDDYQPLFSGVYKNSEIIFLPKQGLEHDSCERFDSLITKMEQTETGLKHFVHTAINDTNDIADFYELANQDYQAAGIIFPHKKVFTQPKLFFVHTIQKLYTAGNEGTSLWLDALKPLRQDEDLLLILEAMLLDTNMNVNESTRLLYIHKNTVYYRLKKIRTLLGFDPFSQPANYNLAIALAIRRLIMNT